MYLTDNKNFIEKLKSFLKERDESPEPTFRFIMKQMYVNDLMNYARSKLDGKVVKTGYGNYDADIVVLLDSMNKNESDFFRMIIPKLDIPIHDVYITSYNKVEKGDFKVLKTIAELELKCISPKCILSVGDHNLKINEADIIVIDKNKFECMLELLAKEELTDLDKDTLQKYKSEIWNQIKDIKKY